MTKNNGLRRRGDNTIWLIEDAVRQWRPPKTGVYDQSQEYSDIAIETDLFIRPLLRNGLENWSDRPVSLLEFGLSRVW